MKLNKKKQTRGPLEEDLSRAPKGAYEEDGGLYGGGPKYRSLKDEMRIPRIEHEAAATSKYTRSDIDERQIIPLLFLFKWLMLGVVGVVFVFFLKSTLRDFNKNSSAEMATLRAQVADLERIKTEHPVLDEKDSGQIPVLVEHWAKAYGKVATAEGLMRWDRRNEALRYLHEALLSAPSYQSARVQTAQILMKNKEYDRATNLLVQALNVDPTRHDLLLMLAQALEKLNEDEAAVSVASWALSNHSHDMEMLGVASRASVRLEDWSSALMYFEKVLIIDENNLDALKGAVAIYYRDKRYRKALPFLLRLMDREPKVWPHFFQAAVCQAQLAMSRNVVTTLELAAANFGDQRVFEWIGKVEFDQVREDDLFRGFVQRVQEPSRNGIRQKNKPKQSQPPAAKFKTSAVPATDSLKEVESKM